MYYHNLAMSPQQRQPDTQQTESLGKGEREAGVGREGKKDSVINEQHKKIVSTAPWQLLRLFQALSLSKLSVCLKSWHTHADFMSQYW